MGSRSKKSSRKEVIGMEAQKQVASVAKPADLDFDSLVQERKKQLIGCLDDMLSVFIEVSKGCDREKVQRFLDHKCEAHKLIARI
jgi:hypothetical protein